MYSYLNAHPYELLVDDCVKRAIVLTTQMDYYAVQQELNRHKRLTGATHYYTDDNPHAFVENVLHAEELSFPARKGRPGMTGGEFCRRYPRGRFILDMPEHWTACVDGVIYDTWDPSDEIVCTAYRMKAKEEPKLNKPKTFFVRVEIKASAQRHYARYTVTRCDEDGRLKVKEIGSDAFLGYKQCLRDLGYKEIK